jgi:hypothetical protein
LDLACEVFFQTVDTSNLGFVFYTQRGINFEVRFEKKTRSTK